MVLLLAVSCISMTPTSTASPTDVVPGLEAFQGSRVFFPDTEAKGAIVVLHGSEGGSQPFAPMLAQRFAQEGLVAASFCWFDCGPGSPAAVDRVPLERTEEFVAWFADGPAQGHPVVLYGASRGAEHALLLASLVADASVIRGVAAHAGTDRVVAAFDPRTGGPVDGEGGYDAAWTWHGQLLYGERELPYGSGPHIYVENYPGPVLLSHGEDDALWPASRTYWLNNWRDDAELKTEVHYWPGEGHILTGREAVDGLMDALVAFASHPPDPTPVPPPPKVTVTDIPEPVATPIRQAVGRCVSRKRWWGTLGIEGTEVHADLTLPDSAMEYVRAAPYSCIEDGLSGIPGIEKVNGKVVIERDPAVTATIRVTGASPQVNQRLLDRAEFCGAAAAEIDTWIDVDVTQLDSELYGSKAQASLRVDHRLDPALTDGDWNLEKKLLPCMERLMWGLTAETKVAHYSARLTAGSPPAPADRTFGSVLAWTTGGRAVRIAIDNKPATCAEISESGEHLPADGALITVVPMLYPDGSEEWHVVDTWYDGATLRSAATFDQGPVVVSGDVASSFTVALPPGFQVGSPEHSFQLPASITATGCGARPPPAPLLAGATLTVVGAEVPVRGALIETLDGLTTLVVADQPFTCESAAESIRRGSNFRFSDVDVSLEAQIPASSKPGKAEGSSWLRGLRFAEPSFELYDDERVEVTLGKARGGMIPVTSAILIHDGEMTIDLHGTFTAIDCRDAR